MNDLVKSLSFNETTIYNFPHTFLTRRNEPIIIKPIDDKTLPQLADMYLQSVPRNSFDGLPPIRDDRCRAWVLDMEDRGINLVALSITQGVVGHAALFPISEKVCEMLLVVSPHFHNMGIGTQLTRCIIQLANEMCLERIWLYGEMKDQNAKHVYKKCGFEYLSPHYIEEVEMVFDIKRYQKTMDLKVSQIMNKNVVTLSRNKTCLEALDIFIRNNFGALPVVDEAGRVIGILSETDLVTETNLNLRVGDILTMDVVTVREDSNIEKLIRLFQSMRLRCIPVVNGESRLVGIVGRKDILSYYYLKFRLGLDFKDAGEKPH
jgi:CBS domain-containing protein/N-acetylglutamate synthase-like GNAT family acetyltransferase